MLILISTTQRNFLQDFHKSRVARTPVFPAPAYNPPEDSLSQDVIATVEKSMKKYADNLMRFLEGISSRLSQLELYCYNLDKSIGEIRSDLNRDHGDQDSKLKSLEKHVQEVSCSNFTCFYMFVYRYANFLKMMIMIGVGILS